MPEVQAPDMPPGMQHKAAAVEPIVTTDDRTGEVTAVVSVTNVVDEVGDIILPGAYTATLAKRKPKGVWSHSWKDWVARTEEIREFPPGDAQLKALLDEAGASLPKDAGALVVRCKFNMDDPDSFKAYQKVKFFSETGECQWSIGYSVPPKMGVRDASGVRRIKGLELFEYSPVLFGAATQSTSLSVKELDPAEWPEQETKDDEPAAAVIEDTDEIDWTAVEVPAPDATEPTADELDAVEDAAREAVGVGDDEDTPGDVDQEGNQPAAQPNAEPPGGEDNDVPPEVDTSSSDGVPDEADGETAEVKRKFSAGERDKAASAGSAMPDGSFPIKSEQDLKNAIQAVGRAKDPDAARRHIIARAKALGLTNLLPDGWTKSEKKDDEAADFLADLESRLAEVERKYDTSPVGKPGGKQNWVDKAGGLPPFIRAVAHALIRAGHSQSQAIQLAVGVIRRWAAGGGDVTAKTRAKAAATIARWDAMKGSKEGEPEELETPAEGAAEDQAAPEAAEAASGEPAELLTKWDPAAEIGRHAAHKPTPDVDGTRFPIEAKELPQLAGTFEERREMVRQALCDLLTPPTGEDYKDSSPALGSFVSIDGTWDDQVVATVYAAKSEDNATWRVPYTIEGGPAGSSVVVLGDPQPVKLTLSVQNPNGDTGEAGYDVPAVLMDGVDSAMIGAKLLQAAPETKAGRVLSGANATKIATAVESLIAVLQTAGVKIDMPEPPPEPSAEDGAEEVPAEQKTAEDADPVDVGLADLLADAARLRALALRSS